MGMMWLLLLALPVVVRASREDDPAGNQLLIFKETSQCPASQITTAAGAPIDYRDTTTLKTTKFSEYYMDSLTHFVRERIPERVVHAKGAGAFGYFEVTHNISDICKAKVFSEDGKKTPIAVRFSINVAERGSIDTMRSERGFAIKFYTEDGNFDIAGINLPTFPFNDPILFPSFISALKRNPVTNLRDRNMFWDFITLRPETIYTILAIFSDRGIPDGYRHMPGYGVHTFQVVNERGDTHFIRFHFTPDAGVKYLTAKEAAQIAAMDPDYATRDLYNAVGTGNFPSWTLGIQVLTEDDAKNAGFDVFDPTRELPLDIYPLRIVGRLVGNENPCNYFADIEQLAFCPGNVVPGILGAPDKLFEARRLAYRDAQLYRLGANFVKIPVNCPLKTKRFDYIRDGRPPVEDNGKDFPRYFPNSFHETVTLKEKNRVELIDIDNGDAYTMDQARKLYLTEISANERIRLVENIVGSVSFIAEFLQKRVVQLFSQVHPDLGRAIREGLQTNKTSPTTNE